MEVELKDKQVEPIIPVLITNKEEGVKPPEKVKEQFSIKRTELEPQSIPNKGQKKILGLPWVWFVAGAIVVFAVLTVAIVWAAH